ncbi:uncharacterized protein LAJ45_09903 [Morchella importuna]|uniref:uncharacterized protein n=1 Tax=Morchella importuna TaxID=1174673 RepID=UPI001E8E56B8|nr:uncharacterized protein LAJ45_09903 [Morchella importuna]KAH8145981.1 hypothetical protein LAJ45_09903 [Morchella importuna]
MGNSQSQPGDGDNDHANFVNQDPESIEENAPSEDPEEVVDVQKVKRRKKKKSKKDKERVDDDEKDASEGASNENQEQLLQKKIKEGEKSKKNGKENEDDDIEDVVTVATTTTTTTTTAVPTTSGEKSKRKKKNRQTSQEEESAQALLALNKGIQEVNSVADGDTVVVAAPEGENSPHDIEQADGADDGDGQDEPKKKKRRGNRKTSKTNKSKSSEEEIADLDEIVVAAPIAPPQIEEASPQPPTNPPILTNPPTNATSQAEDLALLQYTDLQHHSLHEIPDSDRIISQHLAAHMSKHNPIPQSNIPDLGDVLMGEELTGNEFDTDLATLVSPLRNANKAKAPTSYKRKRLPEDDPNKLVDPALRALDAAAGQDDEAEEMGGDKSKRKRRLPADSVLPPTPVAAKRPPRARKPTTAPTPVDGTSGGAGASGNGGTFTLDERHAIDKHLSEYMGIHKLSHADLCSRVWSNDRKKDDFWESVCGVLPNRSRASIYKHVRRSYHVFQQRAKWTAEDDEELARLVAEKGSSWKDVGDAMGRMGEDCRDRWRNYVKCGKDRGRDRWADDEESELRRVLKIVLSTIRTNKGNSIGPEEIDLEADEVEGEEEINWTSVSELMGNKRSRIQCRYKWNKMKQQRARVTGVPTGESRGALWKKRKVKLNVEDMKVGDKVWILEQIRESQAKEEKSIPWDNIGEQSALWSARDLERGYKSMRAHLPHRRLPLHEIISRLLSNLNELPLEIRTERYQPHSMPPTQTPPQPQPQPQNGYEYVHQEHHTTYPLHNPAPVVAMNSLTGDLDTNEYTHHQHNEMDMVDPALIGQGGISSGVQQDLEKTAGEAILIAQAAAAAAQAQEAEVRGLENMIEEEGETERELRRRLGV